jgi:two-component system OmpR family sensor kinase
VKSFLDRTPLRVKLVAAAVALVLAALLITASATAFSLHSYLITRTDRELADFTQAYNAPVPRRTTVNIPLPSDYLVREQNEYGVGAPPFVSDPLTDDDLPKLPSTPKDVERHLNQPYTASAINGTMHWRLLITVRANGEYLVVGQRLAAAESAVSQVILIELIVGGSVLVVLAALGVALVRASLRPLVEIERTAGQIAAGQLGERVPESDPRTEVGRLSRVLNAMLAQIEGAFAARAASEQAARHAEAAAREAAAAARQSEARARRSEERMRQFIADASHELRTPLTTIRGFAELYRQGAVEPDRMRDLLRRIEDEAARMGLLVEDLLLLARLDQERPLVLAPVELRVLVSDAVSAARAVDPDRPITLDLAGNGKPVLVLGDEPRLRQVISNLVTNALTHTPAGTPVTVRLSVDDDVSRRLDLRSAQSTEQNDDVSRRLDLRSAQSTEQNTRQTAVVEVVDTGLGIHPDQAERVFQRFYRVDKARTRQAATRDGQARAGRHSGAGLGLAIVAALVSAHGGTVDVDSAPGHGATFRVRLPLLEHVPEADDEPTLPETSQADPSSSEASAGIVEA